MSLGVWVSVPCGEGNALGGFAFNRYRLHRGLRQPFVSNHPWEAESALAVARAILAAGCLAATRFEIFVASPYLSTFRLLITLYFLAAVAILVLCRTTDEGRPVWHFFPGVRKG
jgi:hypothetical protein